LIAALFLSSLLFTPKIWGRTGDALRGEREISLARQRFEGLLARHALAFADHAAEFYLGPGVDAERAWVLAQLNLANRETDRAVALAIRAAGATGRDLEAGPLVEKTPRKLESCRRKNDGSKLQG
jgi:hypothetical protein